MSFLLRKQLKPSWDKKKSVTSALNQFVDDLFKIRDVTWEWLEWRCDYLQRCKASKNVIFMERILSSQQWHTKDVDKLVKMEIFLILMLKSQHPLLVEVVELFVYGIIVRVLVSRQFGTVALRRIGRCRRSRVKLFVVDVLVQMVKHLISRAVPRLIRPRRS